MKKIIYFLTIISIIFYTQNSFSQTSFTPRCVLDQQESPNSLIGGNHKPERTDQYQGTNENSVFPVILVFVKFNSGEPYPDNPNWPLPPYGNGDPVDLNNYIATQRNNSYGTEWWNAYSEQTARLSDYWMEASRGHFHVIGQAFSITLPLSADQYRTLYTTNGIRKINDDIYYELQQRISVTDWPKYDKWSKTGGTFVYTGDGYIDMIYVTHRTYAPGIGMPAGGIAALDLSYAYDSYYPIPNTNLYIIGYYNAVGDIGSGLRMVTGTPMEIIGGVSFSTHELGHYLWGSGHACYGKMSGAGCELGLDEFLSPWESIKLGYMTPRIVDFNNPPYSIQDYSSRDGNTEGQVLQVPISGSNEFFLIANRQKESSYDKIMWGDTAHDNPYRYMEGEALNYPKGVYIYHTPSGYIWTPAMDQECADGLWNWEFVSYQAPDWDPNNPWIPYFKKTNPVYNYNDYGNGGLNSTDGKSLSGYGHFRWFSTGKKQDVQYGDGTDRVYTNTEEAWTSREWLGDRWDAWKVGYNQVFSPYSSPSTRDWNNNNSQIFIYLTSQHSTTANFKIYKVGEGGYTEDMILQETPPSKPMLYRKIEIFNCNGAYGNPRVIWDNNLESDMLRSGGFKRYKIFRAVTYSQSIAPWNYLYVGTYDDYTPNDTANFIDPNVRIYCNLPDPPQNDGYYRYKIVAVDKYDWESVKSDFLAIKANVNAPDRLILPITPTIFSLEQNYPNPFNPVTEIKYSIPHKIKVSLKIYNLLGEEIADLVNAYKEPGYYTATFDGTNLASGIYLYKLEAGTFVDTKKMVLVK